MSRFTQCAALCVACLPGFAQDKEVALSVTRQCTRDYSYSTNVGDIHYEPEQPLALNLRLGWNFAQWRGTEFQGFGTYHFQSTASIHIAMDGTQDMNPPIPSAYMKQNENLRNQGLSLGIRLNRHDWVDYGLGFEARVQRMSEFDYHQDSIRPWASVHVGLMIPNGRVTNLIGFEAAKALTAESQPRFSLKSFAPDREVGIYMGLRF